MLQSVSSGGLEVSYREYTKPPKLHRYRTNNIDLILKEIIKQEKYDYNQ